MTHPFFQGLEAPLHISHRGGAGIYPENTLEAFGAALELYGTDVIELDLRLTKDGVLVVAHDETVERCTDGVGPVAGFTFAELSKLDAAHTFTPDGVTRPFRERGIRIPAFVEVLRAFTKARINVELKSEDTLEPFAALVKAEGAVDRLCMGSEHDAIATELVKRFPGGCHFYPRDALASFIMPVLAGEPPHDEGFFSVLDMPLEYEGVRLFTPALRHAAAKLGKWINVWTINDEAHMRALIADGVGGIMTDLPDLLRRVIDEKR